MILPSFPISVKFLFIDSDIFRIISVRCITLHTSLTETSSDISKIFRLFKLSVSISFCFSSICKFEVMFRINSSVDFR